VASQIYETVENVLRIQPKRFFSACFASELKPIGRYRHSLQIALAEVRNQRFRPTTCGLV
jgi:hypothetical protein